MIEVELNDFDKLMAWNAAKMRQDIAEDNGADPKSDYYGGDQRLAHFMGLVGEIALFKYYDRYPENLVLYNPPFPDPDVVVEDYRFDIKCRRHDERNDGIFINESCIGKDLDYFVGCQYDGNKVYIYGMIANDKKLFIDDWKMPSNRGGYQYLVKFDVMDDLPTIEPRKLLPLDKIYVENNCIC